MFPSQANVVVVSPSSMEAQNQSSSEEESNASPPCHAVFKYLTPWLMALVALKYNGKEVNPFETHPVNMWVFLIVILMYYLALAFLKEMQSMKKLLHNLLFHINGHSNQTIDSETYSRILGYVVVISGAFSSVSLVSIFLPHLIGQIILWAFLPIILAGVLFFAIMKRRTRSLQENHDRGFISLFKWVLDKFNSATRYLMEYPLQENHDRGSLSLFKWVRDKFSSARTNLTEQPSLPI